MENGWITGVQEALTSRNPLLTPKRRRRKRRKHCPRRDSSCAGNSERFFNDSWGRSVWPGRLFLGFNRRGPAGIWGAHTVSPLRLAFQFPETRLNSRSTLERIGKLPGILSAVMIRVDNLRPE